MNKKRKIGLTMAGILLNAVGILICNYLTEMTIDEVVDNAINKNIKKEEKYE